MYQQTGYYRFGCCRRYYDDQSDALRYEKRILYPRSRQISRRYRLFADDAVHMRPRVPDDGDESVAIVDRVSRSLELHLWREATTISMIAVTEVVARTGLR